jgi:CRISPR-associated protein Cmr4
MKTDLYLITALSNMHVGSGDMNFDIIDRQIQKDPISGLPVIHGSSLKGAYREAAGEESNYTRFIFGPKATDDEAAHRPGAYHFYEARLLCRPVRSNRRPYYNATTPEILQEFLDTAASFGIALDESLKSELAKLAGLQPAIGIPIVLEEATEVLIENMEAIDKKITLSDATRTLLGQNLCLMHHKDLAALPLPVIARNQLEDGTSKNLWYEEVLPRYSRLYFLIGKPDHIDPADEEKAKEFEKRFERRHTMHFGANKSIGYGYCNVKRINS